jgi:cytochrome c
MKSYLIAALAVASVAFAGAAQADEAMAKEKGCLGCHAVDKKKMGPAFKDVAAKYKGDAGAEAALTAKVSEGKGHPKQTKASPDDVKALVKWVLSL